MQSRRQSHDFGPAAFRQPSRVTVWQASATSVRSFTFQPSYISKRRASPAIYDSNFPTLTVAIRSKSTPQPCARRACRGCSPGLAADHRQRHPARIHNPTHLPKHPRRKLGQPPLRLSQCLSPGARAWRSSRRASNLWLSRSPPLSTIFESLARRPRALSRVLRVPSQLLPFPVSSPFMVSTATARGPGPRAMVSTGSAISCRTTSLTLASAAGATTPTPMPAPESAANTYTTMHGHSYRTYVGSGSCPM